MSGAGGAPARREAGGSQPAAFRRRSSSAVSLPGLPMPHAHSYPGPDDEAGLLRKLLKRRSSGLSQAPPQVNAGYSVCCAL